MHPTQGRNLYVVLGMARSGTSAVTRGLQALGISLGHRLTPPCKWHPKGFWEDNDIVYQVNEKILIALHSTWQSLQDFSIENFSTPAINTIKDRTKIILTKRLIESSSFGFKDPRTVRLLPFWQQVFFEMDLNDHYIIVLRNPLAAAHSYQRLMQTDLEHGLLLWVVHAYDALRYTLMKKTVVLSFEKLIQQPKSEMLRLKQALGLVNTQEAEIEVYTSEFLNKSFKHHDANLEDLAHHPATKMAPVCVDLYALLLDVANDQLLLQSEAFKSRWQKIVEQMTAARFFYDYMNKVLQEKIEAQLYIKLLHKTRLWRMIKPLRFVDNFLRQQKLHKQDQKRLKRALTCHS